MIIAGNSYGQKPVDTLCLPTESVRGLLISAKQGEVLKGQVTILNDRIALLQATITQLEQKDSAATESCKNQIELLHQEQAIYKDQLNTYEKLLRREKRKRRLATAAGVLTTGIAIWLGTK